MKSVFFWFLAAVGCHAAELSIATCDIRKTPDGPMVLEARIASAQAGTVDVNRVQTKICIFERCSSNAITVAKADLSFRWLDLPVTWKDRSSERLEVTYPGPKPVPGCTYAGYAIAVYYDGALQDSLYSRKSLMKKFPFPEKLK